MEQFAKATRLKLRFKSTTGPLTTEDLWDLPLQRLDTIAISLNKEVKESSDISFIKEKTTANKEIELKFEVVKYIIDIKLKEQEAAKKRREIAQKRQQLMELIDNKESQALAGESVEELKKKLAELEIVE
jgi:hypothetical protein